MPEFLAQLALSAVVAVLVGLLDGPLLDIHLAWWVCALIGLVVVFGGWFVIVNYDET